MSIIKATAKFIGRDETKKMIQHFEKHHAKKIFPHSKPTERASHNNPSKVAYCAWFSLDVIEDFLKKVQSVKEADGIRIYFGAHDNPGEDFYGYNTAILLGTLKDGTKHTDFPTDAFDDNTYALTVLSTNNLEDLDNARLCPPVCDCGETVLCDALGQPYDSSCSCPQPLKRSNAAKAKHE